jgi:hypothetical protein
LKVSSFTSHLSRKHHEWCLERLDPCSIISEETDVLLSERNVESDCMVSSVDEHSPMQYATVLAKLL